MSDVEHDMMISSNKNFECHVCKKLFKTKRELTVHLHIHTGDKPYQCKTCQKSFSQKGNIDRHIRTRTGAKHYTCKM